MKIILGFLLIVFCILGFSCKKSTPQLPSNKEDNSKSKIEMEKINKILVEKEDSILHAYIERQDISFVKSNAGFYYKIENYTSGNLLNKDDTCTISYKIYLLDDTFVEEAENVKITIGKHETLKGIDLGLCLMRKGERAVFIFPWTLAYGILGNRTTIPAYTSIMIELSVANN